MPTRSAAAASMSESRGKTAPPVQCDARPSKGEATQERILSIAEAMVLSQGFGATSIEGIIAEAGLTKSGFFRGGSVRLNSVGAPAEWISALVRPSPGLASAG